MRPVLCYPHCCNTGGLCGGGGRGRVSPSAVYDRDALARYSPLLLMRSPATGHTARPDPRTPLITVVQTGSVKVTRSSRSPLTLSGKRISHLVTSPTPGLPFHDRLSGWFRGVTDSCCYFAYRIIFPDLHFSLARVPPYSARFHLNSISLFL